MDYELWIMDTLPNHFLIIDKILNINKLTIYSCCLKAFVLTMSAAARAPKVLYLGVNALVSRGNTNLPREAMLR